jgi:hypothetical protein
MVLFRLEEDLAKIYRLAAIAAMPTSRERLK